MEREKRRKKPKSVFAEEVKEKEKENEKDRQKKIIKVWVRKILQKHNPSKVGNIDSLLKKHKKDPYVFYEKVCTKYDIEPKPREDLIIDPM